MTFTHPTWLAGLWLTLLVLGLVLYAQRRRARLLRDFARDAGLRPEDALRARMLLPGGALPNWT